MVLFGADRVAEFAHLFAGRTALLVHNNSLARLYMSEGPEASLDTVIRDALIVPETRPLDDDHAHRAAKGGPVRRSVADGAITSLHVAVFAVSRVRVRVVHLPEGSTLARWCREEGVAHAIVGGFFVRPHSWPLGELRIEADAFMRSMIRVLVGTMLEVAGGLVDVQLAGIGGTDQGEGVQDADGTQHVRIGGRRRRLGGGVRRPPGRGRPSPRRSPARPGGRSRGCPPRARSAPRGSATAGW